MKIFNRRPLAFFLKTITFTVLSALFTACGGGGSDDDRIGPLTMNGLQLNIASVDGNPFPGPIFGFRGQVGADGIEQGSLFTYENPVNVGFIFATPLLDVAGNVITDVTPLNFPDTGAGSYTFQPLSDTGGRLTINGIFTDVSVTPTPAGLGIFFIDSANLFAGVNNAESLIFDLNFDSAGTGFIQSVELIATIPPIGALSVIEDTDGDGTVDTLVENELELDMIALLAQEDGSPVPIGFNNEEFLELFSLPLNDDILTITDGSDGTELTFTFVADPFAFGNSSDETGDFVVTVDIVGDPNGQNVTAAGEYELNIIEDTNLVEIDFTFEEDTGDPSVIGNVLVSGIFALDFGTGSVTRPAAFGIGSTEGTFLLTEQ